MTEPAPSDLIHALGGRLAEAGFQSPGADARLLVAHAAGVDVTELLTKWELDRETVEEAERLVRRRMAGEPVQHITGQAHFRYETLIVGPGVFIPRPETELLAGWGVDWLAARAAGERRVVELCAGSGAVIRSLVREVRGVEGFANELDEAAAAYLRRNLAGLDVAIEIGDLARAFPELDGTVDLVIVNPPYVPETLRGVLPADVVGVDPEGALFAGDDGLDAIREVAGAAARLLGPGGALAVEHDDSHQPSVLGLLGDAGFESVLGHEDLAGRPRFVTATRRRDMARWGA